MQELCILIFGIGEMEYEISMIVQLRHTLYDKLITVLLDRFLFKMRL